MADQTQPWAERTVEVPPQPGVGVVPPQRDGFQRGVAQVGQARPRTTRTEQFPAVDPNHWAGESGPRRPMSWHLTQLRRGGELSAAGGLFAFVCWGIWAISGRGNLAAPLLTFVLSLLTAVGLFALARLLGRIVWERQLGRIRRSARGAHLVTAIFLVGVGVAYLQQTEWVVDAWNWVTGN